MTFKVVPYLRRFLSTILAPVRQNLSFFVFLYVLGIVTTLIVCHILQTKLPRFNFFSWVFDLYIVCVVLTILPRKIRRFFRFFISIFLYLLAIVDTFCVERFHAKFGTEIFNVIMETNQREASEFVDRYITLGVLFSGTCVVFILLIIHIICIYRRYDVIVISKLRNLDKHGFIMICKMLFVFMLLLSFYFCTFSRFKMIRIMQSETISEIDRYVSMNSQNTPFNNLLFAMKIRQLTAEGMKDLLATQKAVTVDSCSHTSNNIVLIIGESYIRKHSQLYGYKLQTTPKQLSLANSNTNGSLTTFTDVISPSNLTSIVFKHIFSLRSVGDTTDWNKAPLFPVLFRKAGYNVNFITNQFVNSLSTDIFNISGGLFFNEKGLSDMQFSHRNIVTHQYDEGLLNDYDSLKTFNGDYNLHIFHLAGQHIDFNKRSPKKWKKFGVGSYLERNDLDMSEKQVLADYDNATLYNDFVLDKIIEKFQKTDAIIIHFSDHGEECYDELHRIGRMSNYTPEVLRQEYRIPFWIWCSNKYIANHPKIFQEISQAKDKPFMTDDLPHLLLYLGGIKHPAYKEYKNPLSDKFNTGRKRKVNGVADYDCIVSNAQL